jgi:hypothetical protein
MRNPGLPPNAGRVRNEVLMRFSLASLTGEALDSAASHFEEHGFIIIDGVHETVTRHFKPLVAERLQVPMAELDRLLDPNSPPLILPVETRKRMSRIDSTPALAAELLGGLEQILLRLLGPFVHVSSTFHGQFKGGEVRVVDHGGYDPKAQYLEVQGQYLIHQDFAGAAIPTSPSGVTLWTPLNSCPDWNLRLYPGSHRHGLVCHEWLTLDDARLRYFGTPIDVAAEQGSCLIFNSLLLHASSNPGPRRRVSCDIRFFPLTGFLPSAVNLLGSNPLRSFHEGMARADGPTLTAPLLESAAFLGLMTTPVECPPYSVLNWANYLAVLLSGDSDGALDHLARFVNVTHGVDTVEIYARKFHNRPVHHENLKDVSRRAWDRAQRSRQYAVPPSSAARITSRQ